MDPDDYFERTRLVIVAGKGGVGKTVVAASLARLAARTGRSTLLVEVDGRNALAPLFGVDEITYRSTVVWPAGTDADGRDSAEISAQSITPDTALVEWLDDRGMSMVSKRLQKTGAIEVIATATPGIKDLLVLGKIKQLVNESGADLVVVDAPASGHAMTFLRAPAQLMEMAETGPIHQQAKAVLDMLGDPQMCEVMLVTLPEETPVNELIDTAFQLEDDVGVQLGPVVLNGRYPEIDGLDVQLDDVPNNLSKSDLADLRAAGDFRQKRSELQAEQQTRLATELPLEQLTLPYIFGADIGVDEIDVLADHLDVAIEQIDLGGGR